MWTYLYSASFNLRKWARNCSWNRVIFLRCGLWSSVAWNQLLKSSEIALARKFGKMVPKLLDNEQKWNWVPTNLDFMSNYHTIGEDLFNQMVTGDEKWVHNFSPEMRSAVLQWVWKGNDHPLKVKREKSASKVYLAAFWETKEHCYGTIPAPKFKKKKLTEFHIGSECSKTDLPETKKKTK